MPGPFLILSDDLIDSSRVTGHGRAIGLEVVHCRTQAILEKSMDRLPAAVIIDLHFPGIDLPALMEQVAAHSVRVIGYGSHVDAARLKAARAVGVNPVLPRSSFFENLEKNLREWSNQPAE